MEVECVCLCLSALLFLYACIQMSVSNDCMANGGLCLLFDLYAPVKSSGWKDRRVGERSKSVRDHIDAGLLEES